MLEKKILKDNVANKQKLFDSLLQHNNCIIHKYCTIPTVEQKIDNITLDKGTI